MNTTQWLTLGSIAVGLIGIYYKHEELKAAFKNGGIVLSSVGRENKQTVEEGSATVNTLPPVESLLRAKAAIRWNRGQGPSPPAVADRAAANFPFKLFHFLYHTMSDNKLVKTILDAATLTGFAAGFGWALKKMAYENFTSDPIASAMNYAQFTAVMAGSIALKQYLTDQKILPDNIQEGQALSDRTTLRKTELKFAAFEYLRWLISPPLVCPSAPFKSLKKLKAKGQWL